MGDIGERAERAKIWEEDLESVDDPCDTHGAWDSELQCLVRLSSDPTILEESEMEGPFECSRAF